MKFTVESCHASPHHVHTTDGKTVAVTLYNAELRPVKDAPDKPGVGLKVDRMPGEWCDCKRWRVGDVIEVPDFVCSTGVSPVSDSK